jgi:hypothetical protein
VFLLLLFLILFAVLGVFIYVGALFFQGYIYTEPTPGLAWRAPAAAAVLASFFTLWCFIVTRSEAVPGNIPYDTIFRFNPGVDMFPKAAPKLWTVKADGTKTVYTLRKNENLIDEYVDPKGKNYNDTGVIAIELEYQGAPVRFNAAESESGYRWMVSSDGWRMQEFHTGPTGVPTQSRWGRIFANLGLNLLHGVLWFVCLWLLLQFRFNDALGFAFVLVLVATIAVLPMLLDQAAEVARARNKAP